MGRGMASVARATITCQYNKMRQYKSSVQKRTLVALRKNQNSQHFKGVKSLLYTKQ